MFRILALFGFAICCACHGVCQAAPSVVAVIDGVDYSNSFAVTPIAQGHAISASISNRLFTFAFDATTDADPGINYHLSIGGDPTVQLTIQQFYLGGPFPVFAGSSIATITDANQDGHVSLLGSPFIDTAIVDGVLAGQYNTGCDLTAAPGFTATCPSSQFQASVSSSAVTQTMELKIAFTLSDGDFAALSGSASLSVPEPATSCLIVCGLLAVGIGPRKRSGGKTCRVSH
jgi:hypothetical protein